MGKVICALALAATDSSRKVLARSKLVLVESVLGAFLDTFPWGWERQRLRCSDTLWLFGGFPSARLCRLGLVILIEMQPLLPHLEFNINL